MKGNSGLAFNLRIVAAIAAKDVVDAFKNKTTLTVVVSALLMVLFYRYLPHLESSQEPIALYLFDPGQSALTKALEDSPDVKVYSVSSQASVLRIIAGADPTDVGLELPADLDSRLAEGQNVALSGYIPQWLSASATAELQLALQDTLASLTNDSVTITLDHRIYPQKDSGGRAFLDSFGMVYVATIVGILLVPHLMFEEKQRKTLEALLISPANLLQIAAGKALASLFYTLTALAVAFAVNYPLITHWPLAALFAVLGSLFSISLGLVLGLFLDNRQQLMLWSWVLVVPLLLPAFLTMMGDLIPAGIMSVFRWTPTAALSRGFRTAFMERVALGTFGVEMAALVAYGLAGLGAITWALKRVDR